MVGAYRSFLAEASFCKCLSRKPCHARRDPLFLGTNRLRSALPYNLLCHVAQLRPVATQFAKMCSKAPPGNEVPLPATFAAFLNARRPRGTPVGAAETHAPAAPACAPLWMAAQRTRMCSGGWYCASSSPRPSARTAGATSTIATGRRRWVA